jgi:hypothetical protein
MKKILFLILFAACIITAAMLNLRMNTQSKSSTIVSYNREALAIGITANPDCHSSSTASPDDDYYDCGPCEKVSGRKGTGTPSKCTYPPQ